EAGAPPALLILGEEGHGVPMALAELCDARVAVPLARGVESLNVATAGAVLAWELFAREEPA
ncbi:MAG: 23S rRNA (guanosine(2251)-2'-O)-methyltransferase RlmB, partial [Planctomycetota bacterium]|nr:23S rRNA (guanosine(2251)-2'-O)-methyltransferase RlmB [Planctomycetota bacterium]